MKYLLHCLLLLVACPAFSQQRIASVVDAERSFARYAIEHNTKDAFLKFMDSSAVVFNNGEVKKAREVWMARKPNPARLIWDPSFAIVSTAGDMGITTGPWQIKPPAKDSVIATGEFSTVWIKKDSGWRWVVDMGIDHNQPVVFTPAVTSIELNHVERVSYDAARYMLAAEQNFISSYSANGKETYRDVADNDIYFATNGFTPVHGKQNIDAALVNLSGTMHYEAVGSGVSKDGDIGYVYGYASEKDKKGNYLRVWRRVGRKWTLILQTLTI